MGIFPLFEFLEGDASKVTPSNYIKSMMMTTEQVNKSVFQPNHPDLGQKCFFFHVFCSWSVTHQNLHSVSVPGAFPTLELCF